MAKSTTRTVAFVKESSHNNQSYWNSKWKDNETGWDTGMPSPAITKYIDQYTHIDATVLIPGCGNAYEAEYLIEKGFSNITLLDISIEAVSRIQEKFKNFPQVRILNQDFFENAEKYDLIIEQTFFCAVSPYKRKDYAAHAASLLKKNGKIAGLLFNKEFEKQGPPFGGSQNDYKSIFNPHFEIKIMEECFNSILPRKSTELFIILNKRNEF